MKVVIIGGVAGGATAAARIRRLDEKAEIIILERSGFVSYANCGLPYYIGGLIKDEHELTLQTPETLWSRYRIEVRTLHEAVSIDREKKEVVIKKLETDEEYRESYDKLILAPGAVPIIPDIPGINDSRIYTLRTIEDALHIKNGVDYNDIMSAVVIGGGFIGLEAAENLWSLGIHITLVDAADQVLPQFDRDMAGFVHSHLKENGFDLRLNRTVSDFESVEEGIIVNLDNGDVIETDMVLMAIGITPESGLAKAAGLELGGRGAIKVNRHMQTSDPDIYAVGDAVEIKSFVTGKRTSVPLAGPANKQGRIAADNIAGYDSRYKGASGTSIIKIYDLTAASTGLNEKWAKELDIPYEKVILSPPSHAAYYPGAHLMTMKVLFNINTWKIIGAQVIGYDGVDKRIDVLAAVMQSGGDIVTLKDIDLAYAPPFSSAKDPINMVGYISENVLTGKVKLFYCEDIAKLKDREDIQRIDVRTEEEHSSGKIDGFDRLIPIDELRDRINELDIEKPVYIVCQSGLRSYIASRILAQEGFDCYSFAGGYRFYECFRKDRFDKEGQLDCGVYI